MTLKYYQMFVAGTIFAIFFTNLPLFLFLTGILPIRPVVWVLVIGVSSLPIVFLKEHKLTQSSIMVIIWCFAFLLISIAWFFPSTQSSIALQELETRVRAVLFLIITMFILGQEDAQTWARRVILIAVLLAVITNLYEVLDPYFFVQEDNEFFKLGRSAGFYINPNGAASAIFIGMIFSIGILREKYRVPFSLFCLLGILTTVSRAGILMWIIVNIICLKQGLIKPKMLFRTIVFLFIITIFTIPFWADLERVYADQIAISAESFERIFISSDSLDTDLSANERNDVLRLGWKMFLESPLIGNGIASTLEWEYRSSTHNMYLTFMVDHGFIGVLILPFLVYVLTWHARGEAKLIAISFSITILIFAFFNHNSIDGHLYLLSYSLMAAMSETSQRNYN